MGMSLTLAFVGFRVQESDFWDMVPANVATCEKGHEQKSDGPFCPLDGTKFERRNGRKASKKFAALATHYQWAGDYEEIYAKLSEDDPQVGRLGIYNVNSCLPSDHTLLAFAKQVADISGWNEFATTRAA